MCSISVRSVHLDSSDPGRRPIPAVLPRLPTDSSIHSRGSRGSRGSDASLWVNDGGWNVPKLLKLSDLVRAALSKGRKLSFTELEDLNFVLDMMVSLCKKRSPH